jgi:hypothetical protein
MKAKRNVATSPLKANNLRMLVTPFSPQEARSFHGLQPQVNKAEAIGMTAEDHRREPSSTSSHRMVRLWRVFRGKTQRIAGWIKTAAS